MSHLPFFVAIVFARIVVLPSRYVSCLPFLIPLTFVLGAVLPILYRLFRSGPREVKDVVEYSQRRGFPLVNPALAQAVDMSPLEMMKNPALRNLERASLDVANIARDFITRQIRGRLVGYEYRLRYKLRALLPARPLKPIDPPFRVGDRLVDTFHLIATVIEVDPKSNHGLGKVKVRYEGREISSMLVAPGLSPIQESSKEN